MARKPKTTRYGSTKVGLVAGSFLAFSALTTYFAARGLPSDTAPAAAGPAAPQRILVIQPNGETRTLPLQPSASVSRPVTRTRGS